MTVTQGPQVDGNREARVGRPRPNPPSKLWVLLGPLGCYVGILKARDARTPTGFFKMAMATTLCTGLLSAAALVYVGLNANQALDRLEVVPQGQFNAPESAVTQVAPVATTILQPTTQRREIEITDRQGFRFAVFAEPVWLSIDSPNGPDAPPGRIHIRLGGGIRSLQTDRNATSPLLTFVVAVPERFAPDGCPPDWAPGWEFFEPGFCYPRILSGPGTGGNSNLSPGQEFSWEHATSYADWDESLSVQDIRVYYHHYVPQAVSEWYEVTAR